ncbi:MAG: transglutaminase family protein [Weeksellaceae bacterium]|nr:transglutaminase family protein [Weeksellaceae bacterium]
MPVFKILHITKYQYPSAVTDSANQIILSPLSNDFQEVISQKIFLFPNASIDFYYDFFTNRVGVFTIVEPHHFLEIRSEVTVETFPIELPVVDIGAAEQWRIMTQQRQQFPYVDFVREEVIKSKPEILEIIENLAKPELSVMETTTELSTYIFENFAYQQGVTDYETEIDEIWKLKAGVCQDFAHLLLAMLRILGVPARYVSGYISPSNQELRGEGATHAWVEVYIPGYGWLGNDPTNNCWVSDRHIKIAIGRDFKDCTPVKGTYKGPSNHILSVSVIITNEKTKEKTTEPEFPMYMRENPKVADETLENNSYRRFLEIQQQQQQQQ